MEPVVCRPLVFTGHRNLYMIPAIFSVRRQMASDPFRSFCYHKKRTVRSFSHHIPGFRPPVIGISMKKVRGKTRIEEGTGRNLIAALVSAGSQLTDWQTKVLCFLNHSRICTCRFIPAVHIAMLTSWTHFCAPMPHIPCHSHRLP